jgi:thioesterase-3
MDFSTDIIIRGYHMDVFGHMNNARYLELMEEARWQYIDATHFQETLTKKNWGFAVVNVNINFKKEIYANDTISFEIEVIRMGNSSMTLEQRMVRKKTGELCAVAEVTFVMLNLENHRPARITEEVKLAFTTAK